MAQVSFFETNSSMCTQLVWHFWFSRWNTGIRHWRSWNKSHFWQKKNKITISTLHWKLVLGDASEAAECSTFWGNSCHNSIVLPVAVGPQIAAAQLDTLLALSFTCPKLKAKHKEDIHDIWQKHWPNSLGAAVSSIFGASCVTRHRIVNWFCHRLPKLLHCIAYSQSYV